MTKIFDLDADPEFKALVAESDARAEETVKFKVFGQVYDLHCGENIFNIMAIESGDIAEVRTMVLNLVVEDQRERLNATLSGRPDISLELLVKLAAKMREAVAERPTKSPSASSRGPAKTATSRTSAGRSSSAVGARRR